MQNLVDLRQRRAAAVSKMEAVLASTDGDLGEEQAKAFDDARAEVASIDSSIKRLEDLEAAKAAASVPVVERFEVGEIKGRIEVVSQPEKKGMVFAKIARSLAAGGNKREAASFAANAFGENHPATKALAVSVGSAGGFLSPPAYSSEVIELLRAQAKVRSAGPVIMDLAGGTMSLPKITAGSTASYLGENQNISTTEPTFGQISLTAKKLAAVVPISNDLLRAPGPNVDDVVLGDLVAGMANTEDAAFLREDGTGNAPKGMYYWANSNNLASSAGTSAANIETDVKTALNKLTSNNVRMIRPAWFMAPRSELHLKFLRNATTNELTFPEVRERGTLMGYPIFATNNIPINLGGGTATELYLADMADVVLAEDLALEIMVSDSAAYHNGSGVSSALSLDQTVIRVIMKHDFAVRHDRSVAVIHSITWGA